MLDPTWFWTKPILWAALAVLLAVLVLRSIRKDRREYRRFKRYQATAPRQKMFRKWLLESFTQFGGLSVGILLLAGFAVQPLLGELASWPAVAFLRSFLGGHPELAWALAIGLVVGVAVLTGLGARAARKEKDLTTIGDIAAMLPRNRQELVFGGLLSINAGIVEEAMFRLALPALVFGASGSAIAAVAASLLLFGALHIYQGVAGVVGTTIVGTLMMLLYAVSGSIVVPMVLHALFDLRTLVVIPMAVNGVHQLSGDARPAMPPAEPVAPVPPAAPLG